MHQSEQIQAGVALMEGQMTMRAPAHYLRVDLQDASEAEYWLVVLDATRQQLERAVAEVGDDARDVRAYLHGTGHAGVGVPG